MEKEAAEELQLLGALGIVREAFNILLRSSRTKLLWALALTLLLPLSFASLGSKFIFNPFLLKMNEKQMEALTHPSEPTGRELNSERRELLVVIAAYIAFVVALLILSTVSVVYTVASIYTANTTKLRLSYVKVLRADVPRVWKRLMLTHLWFFIISLGVSVAYLLLIIFLLTIFFPTVRFAALGGGAGDELKGGAFLFGIILAIVVLFCLQIYISTVWYLANVVSVLEDKYYGLAAIQKSSELIKGKRMTASALLILSLLSAGVIARLFGYVVLEGRSHGVGAAARAVSGILLAGLLCFVSLMGILTQSVLYFACKSYHHENIDANSSFKFYKLGDYEPLKTSSIQLEDLHVDV